MEVKTFTPSSPDAYICVYENSDEGFTIVHCLPITQGNLIETEYTINFCPMCGRKLGDTND